MSEIYMRNKTLLSALGAVMIVGLSLGLVPAALAATPVLTAINLTPAVVAVGATHQFTASPLDQFGNPIAATLTWSSSNTSVGTVSGSGMFSALAVGSATVTATSGSVSGSTTATVVPATPVLTTITLSPSSANVMVGNTRQFTATTRDQFGNPIAASLTWTSNNTTVGTVNGSGLFSALAAGSATVTATSGAVSGSATATVVSATPVLTTINVSPSLANVTVGNTRQFTAALLDQFGNPISGSVSWSLSNSTVGSVNSSGLFTAAANGSSQVIAQSGNVTGYGTVMVTTNPPAGNHEHDEHEEEGDENEGHKDRDNHHEQGEDSHWNANIHRQNMEDNSNSVNNDD